MCTEEHPILGQSGPLVICMTDQCFVNYLSENCIGVVRLENVNLMELASIFLEIFEGRAIPNGSIVLLGSGSHLFRVGASAYTWE